MENETGRRVKDVPIEGAAFARDIGKVFQITEMSAEDAEAWAIRAMLALTAAGVDIGEAAGMEAIAVAGLQSIGKLSYADAKPLLDDMFKCVKIVPDPKKNPTFARDLFPGDIQEVATRLYLRAETFALHVGFSKAGDLLKGLTSGQGSPARSAGRTSRRRSRQS